MFLGQMLGCVLQEAAGLLRQATDESCDWNTRIKCLSELSHALEIEESKYEVGAPVQAMAIWAFCFAHAHKPAALAISIPLSSQTALLHIVCLQHALPMLRDSCSCNLVPWTV